MSGGALAALALLLLGAGALADLRRPCSPVGEVLADLTTWAGVIAAFLFWTSGGAR